MDRGGVEEASRAVGTRALLADSRQRNDREFGGGSADSCLRLRDEMTSLSWIRATPAGQQRLHLVNRAFKEDLC
jgi:hypothetical protein